MIEREPRSRHLNRLVRNGVALGVAVSLSVAPTGALAKSKNTSNKVKDNYVANTSKADRQFDKKSMASIIRNLIAGKPQTFLSRSDVVIEDGISSQVGYCQKVVKSPLVRYNPVTRDTRYFGLIYKGLAKNRSVSTKNTQAIPLGSVLDGTVSTAPIAKNEIGVFPNSRGSTARGVIDLVRGNFGVYGTYKGNPYQAGLFQVGKMGQNTCDLPDGIPNEPKLEKTTPKPA